MKTYKGKRVRPSGGFPSRESNDVIVTVNGEPLEHRVYHSPTGMEWGYLGSGPADLARSILWDFLGKEPIRELYMLFKEKFVSGWKDEWQITSDEIKAWIIDVFGESYYNYLIATGFSDPRD